jgi:hypothetical protein
MFTNVIKQEGGRVLNIRKRVGNLTSFYMDKNRTTS